MAVYNFAPGPAVLPAPVIEEACRGLRSLADTGIGVLEHSHRGRAFLAVYEHAVQSLRSLAGIPDDYEVLFLQGGASSQFFMVPMSFSCEGRSAEYLISGTWGQKAYEEARLLGVTHIAATSADRGYAYVPRTAAYGEDPVYVHYTSNETIEGVQWHLPPPSAPHGAFLVCDASSDILSRPLDTAAHGIVYAGAQKNLGPAGLTVVLIRRDLVERGRRDVPAMLQYRIHAAHESMYNTPPTFGIYVLGLVCDWIAEQGGPAALGERNRARAERLYAAIDASSLFRCPVDPPDRSHVNATFLSGDPAIDEAFVGFATARGLQGLKGHRSVGGMRASMYNAFPNEGVDALIDAIATFEEEQSA